MPYPNEHACRLASPDKFSKFNRVNGDQKHDGKPIDVIYGIANGKSEIQALRFPKGKWTADAARSVCSARGGSFTAASEKESDMAIKSVPRPSADEDHGTFIQRCMSNPDMNDEYPEQTRRAAMCYAAWRGAQKKPKEQADLITKEIDIKTLDDDTFVVVATDESTDRDGDKLIADGGDVKNFMKVGSFVYGHMKDNPLPVASPIGSEIANKSLLLKGKWADPSTSEFHKAVRSLVKQGILKGVSIGFLADRKFAEDNKDIEGNITGKVYKKWELIECSFTPIPSNANARVIAKDFSEAVQRELFEPSEEETIEADAKEIETIFKDVCISLHIDIGADGSISAIHGDDDGSDGIAPFDPSTYSTPEEGMAALLQYARKYLKLPAAQHEAEDAEAAESEGKVKGLVDRLEGATKG